MKTIRTAMVSALALSHFVGWKLATRLKLRLGRPARAAASLLLTALFLSAAHAEPTYISGRINNVTFASDYVMIMVDAGLPDNCAGTAWGWMKIPPENKAMTAFVLGLWMRGDAASTGVTVYTDGLVGGYCRISQIDPVG